MKVAVVLVTYNRLSCLKIALHNYEEQTVQPEYMVIVDNASTDGTKEYLDQWNEDTGASFERIIIHSETNLGGSGGFSLGMERAMKLDCDYLFLADDDAYAEPDMLEKLDSFEKSYQERERIAALCTVIVNEGKIDCTQRTHIRKRFMKLEGTVTNEIEYAADAFEVDSLSFVGAAIKKATVANVGLPIKDYFIHYDDTEYSMRMRTIGQILLVSKSRMHHNTVETYTTTWKNYYSLRNELITIKNHFPKRYYYYLLVGNYIKKCSILAAIIKKRTPGQRRMFKIAIRDAMKGKLGISEVYKPGVDVNKI